MARPIDADRLLRVLESNFGHTGGAAVMRQLVEMQPTLEDTPTVDPETLPIVEKLRDELERMKAIMRYNGIVVIPSKYPGGRSEWNISKLRG